AAMIWAAMIWAATTWAATTAAASHTIGLSSALDAMALSRGVEPSIALLSAAVVGLVLLCSITAQLLTTQLNAYTAQRAGSGALIAALVLLAVSGAAGSLTVFLLVSVIAGF